MSNGDCRSDFENHIDDQVNDDEEDSSVNNLWGQMILTNNIIMMTVIMNIYNIYYDCDNIKMMAVNHCDDDHNISDSAWAGLR